MTEMTTIRLSYTGQSGGLYTLNGKGGEKIVLANYNTSNHALKSEKVPTTLVGNLRLISIGYILYTLD